MPQKQARSSPLAGLALTAVLAGCGLLVSIVPLVGGLFAIALGVWFRRWGAEQQATAARHRFDEPARALDELRVGDVARVVGTAHGGGTVATPLGQQGVLAVGWIDTEPDEVAGRTQVWRHQWGDALQLDSAGGELVVESAAMDVIAGTIKTTTWTTEPPEAIAALLGEQRGALLKPQGLYEYGERVLASEAELAVTGRVVEIRPLAGSGYRDGGGLRVRMVDPDNGSVKVAPSEQAVANLALRGKAGVAGGILCIVTGIASFVVWIRVLNL